MKIIPFLIFSFLMFHLQAQDTNAFSLYTKAHLEFMRDIQLEIKVDRLESKLDTWNEVLGPNWQTEWPRFTDTIQQLVNESKSTINLLDGLKDTMLMVENTKAEMELMSRIRNSNKLKKKYSTLSNRIESLANERGQIEAQLQFYTSGDLALLDAGINMVQSLDPMETKENQVLALQKLKHYTEAFDRGGVWDNLLRKAFFVNHLNTAHNWLHKSDPYLTKVFDGLNGEEFLTKLYGDNPGGPILSLVAYAEKRDSLITSGWEAIQKSEDPVIVTARELVILMRENKYHKEELDEKEKALYFELSRAFFRVNGMKVNIIAYDVN